MYIDGYILEGESYSMSINVLEPTNLDSAMVLPISNSWTDNRIHVFTNQFETGIRILHVKGREQS